MVKVKKTGIGQKLTATLKKCIHRTLVRRIIGHGGDSSLNDVRIVLKIQEELSWAHPTITDDQMNQARIYMKHIRGGGKS